MDLTISLLAVLAIYLPALMLPGPDFVAVVRTTLVHGAAQGIRAALGVALGLSMFATLSLVGLAALLAQAEGLAFAVKLVGGAYLIYLGIKLIRAAPHSLDVTAGAEDAPAQSSLRGVLFGLSVTLTNPKAVVLFASVFATAVPAEAPSWFLALLVAIAGGAALVWYTTVALVLAAPPILARLQRARQWIDRAAGAGFILIGLAIMARSRTAPAP